MSGYVQTLEQTTAAQPDYGGVFSNTSSCSDSVECQNLIKVSEFLVNNYIWIVFAVGFPGNVVSFCVIVGMSRHRLSTSLLYVALLAVIDNVAIILKIIMIQLLNGKLVMDPIRCKILYFCGLTLVAYANWILIVMSAERFTAVGFPLKVGIIWSLRRSVTIVAAVFLFLCAMHLHMFFSIDGTDRSCWPKQEYLTFYYPWWFYISSSLFSFIPSISIIIFNILIIRLMRRSTNRRKLLLSRTTSALRELRHQERQVTVMLITLAVVFITLTIPRCVFITTESQWKPEDDLGAARKKFLDALTNSLADTNHAINFYLYFVAITKFRNYFLNFFQCCGGTKKYVDLLSGQTQISEMSVHRKSRRDKN